MYVTEIVGPQQNRPEIMAKRKERTKVRASSGDDSSGESVSKYRIVLRVANDHRGMRHWTLISSFSILSQLISTDSKL